jgi:hypothetical protein
MGLQCRAIRQIQTATRSTIRKRQKKLDSWNALADAAYNKYITKVDNIATRNFAEITFIPELKLRTTLSLDYYLSSYSGYTSATYGYMAGRGAASKSTTRSVTTTWTNLLTYDKTFGKHGVSVCWDRNLISGCERLSGSKEGFPLAVCMNSVCRHNDRPDLLRGQLPAHELVLACRIRF